MRLAPFIRSNIEKISAEWESFATTLLPREEFSRSVLRDGIVEMLHGIATDMELAQNADQQQGKSEGDPTHNDNMGNAAERHAVQRVKMGLSSRQVISEFRALRATVIRLWQADGFEIDKASLYDLTRFNEAIDQVLTEAAVRYTEEMDRARETFLGILGHDLRNPLSAISGFAELQLRTKNTGNHARFASQILVCVGRMSHMITDLIELTRVRLGAGILVKPTHTSMRHICMNVIAEMMAIHPRQVFQLNCTDELLGDWDEARMSQVLSNLLGNAVQHGKPGSAVTVTAKHEEDAVALSVHNEGTPIPPDMMPLLFNCLFQGPSDQRPAEDNSTSLGLGLYIAREIVTAHGGTIAVESSDEGGTTFTARLPLVGGSGSRAVSSTPGQAGP
jgi:signal transduction histidine kinase